MPKERPLRYVPGNHPSGAASAGSSQFSCLLEDFLPEGFREIVGGQYIHRKPQEFFQINLQSTSVKQGRTGQGIYQQIHKSKVPVLYYLYYTLPQRISGLVTY